ncbi:hypothetical protein M406DRAFT_355187 [Cryphonectria parasitica EP155]|uniref:Uncharacterized protein n=1 Tax=Cryphonectria parasitica (strain ATCC 38755 / EP155) TaxID=660469 RepID=A0A9P5CSZ5_CRYP1|nr:uncharacterized protein M406DRAFT_355187 [Cryphonectria parasitica EP155]KAF3769142.1 hypothetical protein M406DRAFT_355187 [Cryphonectria parasitica EP155]
MLGKPKAPSHLSKPCANPRPGPLSNLNAVRPGPFGTVSPAGEKMTPSDPHHR